MVLTKFSHTDKIVIMKRSIETDIIDLALSRNKMAFISGPRQVGKTTLSKNLAKEFDSSLYCNWDEIKFRKIWTKSPNEIVDTLDLTKKNISPLIVFDEIHKSKLWKQKIKGIYDHHHEKINILVTGSARLNVFKKGGDSLLGRYLNFRIHPLSYGELTSKRPMDPEAWKKQLFSVSSKKYSQIEIEKLLTFTGFPEPYLEGDSKILNIWSRSRQEKIVREDLRDLSRLPELSQIEMLISLLDEKVGGLLSVQSLREDLEVAHTTVTRWLKYLEELYYFFELKPHSSSIPRSLKKEGKIYLYDWSQIEDKGARFENLVASQLLKAVHYWSDTGEGNFDLRYLRNKEKEEVDFLILKNKKPWLMIESKFSDTGMNQKIVTKYQNYLKCPYVQVVFANGHEFIKDDIALLSANRAFFGLP